MNKLTFKQFQQKYKPVRNHNSTAISPWDYTYDQQEDAEYVNNKRTSYVWSVFKDLKGKRIIVIPGKSFDAIAFIITTVPYGESTIEYFKIRERNA